MSSTAPSATRIAITLRPEAAGRAYYIAGPPESPLQILRQLRQLSGRGPLLIPVPIPIRVRYDTRLAAEMLGFSCRSLCDGLLEVLSNPAGDAVT